MIDTGLSVVVRVADRTNFTPTTAALDVQTAPTDQWQLVLVATGEDARRRAVEYQQFRPNVIVVAPGDDVNQAVTDGWVWEVAAADILPRTALARVLKAIRSGAGLPIVARAVSRERQENDWLFHRPRKVTGAAALLALGEAAVILPRALWAPAAADGGYPRFEGAVATWGQVEAVELLAGGAVLVGRGPHGAASDAERVRGLVSALAEVDSVVAADIVRAELGRQSWAIDADSRAGVQELAARIPDPTLPVRLAAEGRFDDARALHQAIREISWEVNTVEAEWDAGTLRIRGSATLQLPQQAVEILDGADLADLGAPRPRLGLRNRLTTSTVPLPTTVEIESAPTGWKASFVSGLDIDGWVGALPNAAYQVALEAPGLPGNPLVPLRRDGLHLPGIVRDRLVTLRHEAKGGLHLDVGASRQSLLGRLDPAGAQIEESLRGSALSVPTPPLHVWPADRQVEELQGELLLGGLAFPAVLQLDPPTVHCLVSGLPGSLAIQTRFGKGKATQTGCELRVSPDGKYSVGPLTTAETSGISTLVASGTSPKRGGAKPTPGDSGASATKAAPGSLKPAATPAEAGPLQVAWRRLPDPVKDRLRGPAKRLLGR